MGIELPAELADVATAAGVRWPQADEEAMRSTAQAWRTAGTRITALAKDADGTANQALTAVHGATGTAAAQHWNTFVAADTGHLTRAAKGCTEAADRLDHAAEQVGAAKVQIVRHLVDLAKNQDAANQAAAAGHPTALAGLTTTVHGTAADVAQVNHTLTNSIRLDNGTPGQGGQTGPVHGATSDLLGSSGPLGAHGPLGPSGSLSANGPLGTNGPLGANGMVGGGPAGSWHGPLGVVQPVMAPVTHGVDQVAGPVVDNTVGPIGGHGGGLGLDPEHTGPISAGTIGAAAGGGPGSGLGPGLGGHGPLPLGPDGASGPVAAGPVQPGSVVPGSVVPGSVPSGPVPPAPDGPGQVVASPNGPGPVLPTPAGPGLVGPQPDGPITTHGATPPMGITVAQSAAPPVAPPVGVDHGSADLGITPATPMEQPAESAPPAASFSAPTPSFGTPMPTGGPQVPAPPAAAVSRSGTPDVPPQSQNWGARGGGAADVVGAPVAVPRSGAASVRQGPRSAAVQPNQGVGGTGLPGLGTGPAKPAPRGEAVALFLVYLFPLGQLPKAAGRPVRQLPPPAPETDFAAGLRFEPHDHPRSDLIDVTAAPDEPAAPVHPGFAVEDPEVAELADGHDPLGGENERDWDRRFLVRPPDPDGGQAAEYAWPPGELFPEGGCDAGEPVVLAVDTVIDRFGTAEGRVFAEDGTPFARRSLPPDHLAAGYHRYRVTRELPMWRTLSAAWFGQSGGGVRYRAVYPAADLVALGYLADITGTDNGH